MSFLQPLLLAALPLVALPIVIHLINQRRYQTIQWAAMMFLLAANRMSRGYARLRQWWIMLFRMLAIAGLIFAVSRPLATGRLGMAAGSGVDTTIVLLDRSPSMRQQRRDASGSKLETGRQQLVRLLNTLSSSRWVLIESTGNEPRELESPDALLSLPDAEPTSASSDVPAMLEAARNYIEANRPGRTEIWVCSDIRQNDWNADDGRWQALRSSLLDSNQSIRLHLLAYPEAPVDNVAVRVTEVKRRQTVESAELLVSLKLSQEPGSAGGDSSSAARLKTPVQFDIEGARSELTVELVNGEFELKDHRIPIDGARKRGWGRVSIPADANLADNDFYFVFDEPAVRQTLIVSADPQAARPLQLAAAISPDPAVRSTAEIATPEQLAAVEWDKLSLVLWQAALPTGETADRVREFVDRGGVVMFFPPRDPTGDAFAGVRWQTWVDAAADTRVDTWRGDHDLLEQTESGTALPVGQLEVRKYCAFSGDHTPLATFKGGVSLFGRATTARGGVYFSATTPATGDSSLAANGIVLYVLVQRALAIGAAAHDNARQVAAGDLASLSGQRPEDWQRVSGTSEGVSTAYAFHAGVYRAGEKLLAINRGLVEDAAAVLSDERVAGLFQGLDFARVDDQAGNLSALINEIWRPFLIAMIVALIVEAVLCLPRISPVAPLPTGGQR